MVSANWASSHRPLGLMLFFETFPTPHLKCSHGFHTRLVILFTCSCQHQADAWQRLMFGKLPATICLQLMRFSSTGKKLQNMVKYDDMLVSLWHKEVTQRTSTETTYFLILLFKAQSCRCF